MRVLGLLRITGKVRWNVEGWSDNDNLGLSPKYCSLPGLVLGRGGSILSKKGQNTFVLMKFCRLMSRDRQ